MAKIGDTLEPSAKEELRRWVENADRHRRNAGPEVYDRELARLKALVRHWPSIEEIEVVLRQTIFDPQTIEDEVLLTTTARRIMALFLPSKPDET